MGRLWQPKVPVGEAAARPWIKGSTLILCGVIDGPAAPAVGAVPTPRAAATADAASRAPSFDFTEGFLTDELLRVEMGSTPSRHGWDGGGPSSNLAPLVAEVNR